jgi:hypothetical protein
VASVANSRSYDGSGIGSYNSNIFALTHTTTYYVRAYAINSIGTAYGNEVSFTTLKSSIEEHLQNGSIRLYSDMNKIFVKVNLDKPGNHKVLIYDLTGHQLSETMLTKLLSLIYLILQVSILFRLSLLTGSYSGIKCL